MFRSLFPITAIILLAGISASAAKPHAHKAIARPTPGAQAGCLDNSRYLSHIAFVPAAAAAIPPRCGHLLSTDTLLTIRHWNQT